MLFALTVVYPLVQGWQDEIDGRSPDPINPRHPDRCYGPTPLAHIISQKMTPRGDGMGGQPPNDEAPKAQLPRTFRVIAQQALERLPKLCGKDDCDLVLFGANRLSLVEDIAQRLASKAAKHLKGDAAPMGIDDSLDPATLERLHKSASEVNQVAREVVGRARRPAMEEAARKILHEEDTLSPEDAAATVVAIHRNTRRSIPESSDRTFDDCVDGLVALCRAHLSRVRGERTAWQSSVPERDAAGLASAMRATFTRAVHPALWDAETAEAVGSALTELTALERRVKAPEALKEQLAAEALLNGGQDEQLHNEIRLRAHFPFGLVLERSHAVLAAALFLLRAQAPDSAVRAATQERPHPAGPRELYFRTRNAIAAAVVMKSQQDSQNGWHRRFETTPGMLDCLRAAASVLIQDQVPAFAGIPGTQLLPGVGADPAHRLLSVALPLNERTRGDGTVSWGQASWNPLGGRLLHIVNREYYSLRNRRYFNENAFQEVVTGLTHHALEELLKRLHRAEGIAAGLPNSKEPYNHRSLLSLNKFLTLAWSTASGEAFGTYRAEIEQVGASKVSKPPSPPSGTPAPVSLPAGVVLLSSDGVRSALEKLLTASEPYEWSSQILAGQRAITEEEIRTAALDAIQVIDWAAWNEPELRGHDLNGIIEAYRGDQELGNPLTVYAAARARDLLFDTVLTDETTRRILSELALATDTNTDTDETEQTTEDASEDTTR